MPAARELGTTNGGGCGVAADTSLQQPKGNVNGMTVVNSGSAGDGACDPTHVCAMSGPFFRRTRLEKIANSLNLGINFEEIRFSKFYFFSAVNEV